MASEVFRSRGRVRNEAKKNSRIVQLKEDMELRKDLFLLVCILETGKQLQNQQNHDQTHVQEQ